MEHKTPGLQVLVIGLDPYRAPGPWDPQPIAEAIQAGMTALADLGHRAETCLLGLEGGEDHETQLSQALASRPWDCVMVGGGIRKPEELLGLFESIINLIRRHAPQAAIAFNSTPQDLADAVARSSAAPA
ncbi:hypothetical protein [Nocardioides houyundeii]|uniref:hypothetical protein n=1 Tax=Nocardioides houyundeii TaxID=2045452 RepID=UPI0018F04378|nr:hypothetical protein [Nocardioides houyundeii]